MTRCECCGQPKPVLCVVCGNATAHIKSKKSKTGNRYQVRECAAGHTTVVTHDGQVARRYSRDLEHDGMPAEAPRGKMRRDGFYWALQEIRR